MPNTVLVCDDAIFMRTMIADILTQAAATLDFTQPIAVLLLAVLHFLPDTDNPAGVVAKLAGALAPGSYLVISHLTADLAPGQVGTAVAAYNTLAPVPVTPRTHAQVTGLFGRLLLIIPVEQVLEVVPQERRIVLRASPRPTAVERLRSLRGRGRGSGGGG